MSAAVDLRDNREPSTLDALGSALLGAIEREAAADTEKLDALINTARAMLAGKTECGSDKGKWGRWIRRYGWEKSTRAAWTRVQIAEHEVEYRAAWVGMEDPTIYGAFALIRSEDVVDDRKPTSGRERLVPEPPRDLGPAQSDLRAVLLGMLGGEKATGVACLATDAVCDILSTTQREAVLDAMNAVAPHVDRDDVARMLDAQVMFLRDT